MIPEEIPSPEPHYEVYQDNRLLNINKFHADLNAQRIPTYPGKHQGHVYYKDEKPYYGPTTTYNKIPEIDTKFAVKISSYLK